MIIPDFRVFKGGKAHAVTFSYDDGKKGDLRLEELFNKYGLKCTFNLNGCNVGKENYMDEADIKKLVADGHEIALHGWSHTFMEGLSTQVMLAELEEDKKKLEQISGTIITGMAYPYGTFNADLKETLRVLGIKYSRTGKDSGRNIPSDFLEWGPTAHHRNFSNVLPSSWHWRMLYIWGHTHDFKSEDEWTEFEENLKQISFNDDYWYATNGEICEYLTAQKNLIFNSDYTKVYNPSCISVWIKMGERTIEIKPKMNNL